jgi:hypothetical protein
VVEEAFWTFVDQKWRDALNIAVAEPAGWNPGGGGTRPHGADKKGPAEAKKLLMAAIHVATTEEKPPSWVGKLRGAHLLTCLVALDNTPQGGAGRLEAYGQKSEQKS